MGKRIHKSKRHKKVKAVDPFYTGERKLLLDKNAKFANAKPLDINDQEIPRRLRELMTAKDLVKRNMLPKQRRTKKQSFRKLVVVKEDDFGSTQPGMKRPLKPVPTFKPKNGETQREFIARVSKSVHNTVEKTKEENKLGVEIIEHPGGKVELRKQEEVVLEEDVQSRKKSVKKTSKKPEKRKEKLKAKKLKKLESKLDEFDELKDIVPFGEVVMEPPSLHFKSKNSSNKDKKLGSKSLLLSKLLPGRNQESVLLPNVNSSTNRTVKRKLLPAADRRQLDQEQERVVSAYREIKKRKVAQNPAKGKDLMSDS